MNIPAVHKEKLLGAIAMIRRTGASSVSIRYSDDEQPVVWLVVASYPEDRHEVDAALDPIRAILRLLERLVDGGQCQHCGRPTGLEPDSLETMPLDKFVCWYQWDPEVKTFRRGCEGDVWLRERGD